MTLYPTHTCFDDAVDFVNLIADKCPDKCPEAIKEAVSRLVIVHAICLLPNGSPYAHAWVEDKEEGICVFRFIVKNKPKYFNTPIEKYYVKFQVQETTKYTIEQAVKETRRTGTSGPWEQRYLVLTRGYTEKNCLPHE